MKKHLYLFILLAFPLFITAQNVGIGTTAPTEKLEIKNPLRSTLKISSNSTLDTTELQLSNKTVNGFGTFYTDFSIKSIREEGLFFSSSSDFGPNNSANSLVILPNGNLGTGIAVPTAKLHINGGVKVQGLNLIELGAGVVGKEANAGKIGYNAFGTNALAFVGAGSNSTNRAVYFFAEGGTTFSGPALITGNTNIGGQLQLNGNPGTAGQILTSKGAAAPVWTNAAFSNTTRFAASIPRTFEPNPLLYSVIYNINTTDVTISGSTITINKSGLYHFEGVLEAEAVFGTQAPAYLSLNSSFFADGHGYDITNFAAMDYDNTGGSNWTYRKTLRFANDVHISAPATVSVGASINFNAGGAVLLSRARTITLSGYLISE